MSTATELPRMDRGELRELLLAGMKLAAELYGNLVAVRVVFRTTGGA